MLLKAMPISFIQVSPDQTSEVGITPSFPANLMRDMPDIVNTHRAGSHVTRRRIETHQGVSDSSASPPLVQSFLMDSEQLCKSRIASSSQALSADTHRESEAPTRAWSKVVSLQFDKMPPTGVLECFEKRSVVAARPAAKQALAL